MDALDFKIPPVVKTILYAGAPESAFDRFTRDIGKWWPLATHSIGKTNALSVGFEPLAPGGVLVEHTSSGERHVWGTITDIDRPHRLSFTWHVGRHEDTAQLIALTFAPNADGTTAVTLTHAGWERLGEGAAEAQRNYTTGWDPVLARYANTKT